MIEVPVLIVGGGPVGLTASIWLSQHGIRSLLVERHPGTAIMPKARGINARTMEMYRQCGVEAAIREAGLPTERTGLIVWTKTLAGEEIERRVPGRATPKNLAMSLAIEAAELMEHFQWLEVEESRHVADAPAVRQAIGEEMADVASYLLAMCNVLQLDLSDAVRDKMAKNARKYPVEQFKGRYGPEDQRGPAGTGGGDQGQPAPGDGPAGLEAEG